MKKDIAFQFALAGSMMTIIFIIVVNSLSTTYPWFIYPTFALLLWPIGIFCAKKKNHKLLSIVYSLIIIAFLVTEIYIQTPEYPWFLYALPPLLCWPVLAILDKHSQKVSTAILCSASIIGYYIMLNLILSPQHPWAIYPAFAVLWWPLALYHGKTRTFYAFSLTGSLLVIAFFAAVNAITTPDHIWAVYPIFCILWWPLSMYYYGFKKKKIA
ncbi:hypothetical protein [Metabacillus niabensis]|uniref:hypothetical protein n=1 Tax=Metabacillus niabensis TaxID=324854 RepID=UPI0039A0677C